MNKYKVGYTSGVYDMFHIGHLNVLKNAKSMCDFLIVGVSTDDVVELNKNKKPVIPFGDRASIVGAIKYVDLVIPQTGYDVDCKLKTVLEHNVDVVFVGSDWQGTKKWDDIEKKLGDVGCKVVYLPHTDGISTTILREMLKK